VLVAISPHLDDAVFSCGALIASHATRVVTIAAGIPAEEVPAGHFDTMAGFKTAADAIRARRVEDVQAAAVLGAEMLHGDCPEDQYDSRPGRSKRVGAAVRRAFEGMGRGDVALGPLGLRHPDHELVGRAFREEAARVGIAAWLYEELPYRALWPEFLRPALDEAQCDPASEYFADTAPAIKHRALRCYTTQLVGMDTQPLLLPERYHRLQGKARLW
jgi:LmbE family N-acetylglucosaminyl deacetylase